MGALGLSLFFFPRSSSRLTQQFKIGQTNPAKNILTYQDFLREHGTFHGYKRNVYLKCGPLEESRGDPLTCLNNLSNCLLRKNSYGGGGGGGQSVGIMYSREKAI